MIAKESDIVESWASLMEEWACASKELDIALAMERPADPANLSDWHSRVDDARRRQDDVKQKIDALITEAVVTRTTPKDGIIIGRLSRENPGGSSSAPDEQSK
ncbi:MAG TPA: hypothetical protein VGO22_05615 [Pseudorhizobium sp.]|jgi:hypothetical protein|nr:hypothetical protein [Pseudorhizobium sp.]